ncbi:MAG TPA: Stk1 family PASTA domain-containing Ser/Thr kinase [Bacillales bacterium]|nr:Stk1 family PASTA domain-containing Ser/Thr kinase [Bacillales bacterium]
MLGKRIGGRYELLSVVGGGGMAVVYKARDVILDRVVAVKVLRPEFSNDDEFIRRFRREAQSVTSLFHPNIVNIYDVGDNTDENGSGNDIYYMVMQYVEGETLKDLIKREAPLPLGQELHIMDQITSAIEHAHEQNIVHRDIKPQNILIDNDGEAKVTDFGIAIAMSSATITHTNSVIGSAHYFSPEQARGGYANTKSDIYSLGIVLFEMLTGELPFSGTSPVSVALKHLQEDIPDPRELNPAIPQSVENIILKALSKDPNHRYNTVEAMRDDLKTALDPGRLDEPKFMAPDEEGETTKIMAPVMGASVNGNDNGGNGGNNGSSSGDSGSGSGGGPKKKKGKTKKLLWILLLLLLLIGGAAVSAFTIMPDILSVESVKMPKVVGMDIGKAKKTLKHKGLKVRSEKVSSSKYDKGKVVRQNPAAHTLVKKKTFVNLFVSKGPKKISLDNYIGMDKDTARLILNESNFKKVSFQPVHSDTYVEGMVMKQSPAPGTRVAPENTKIVLTYSSGPKSVEIPDLTGYTKEGAQNLLEDRGLTPDFQEAEYSDTVGEGQVTRQSPDPGTEVDPGGTVEFWVSKGPQPEPEPTQPPTDSGSGSGTTGENQADPITFQQPITVQMPEHKGNGKGQPVHVKIVYSDANHDQQTFKEEDIHETKKYDLQMTVAPDGQVEVWVYVDENLQDHFTKSYQQVQGETGGNG